jgi:hypothetical protein
MAHRGLMEAQSQPECCLTISSSPASASESAAARGLPRRDGARLSESFRQGQVARPDDPQVVAFVTRNMKREAAR